MDAEYTITLQGIKHQLKLNDLGNWIIYSWGSWINVYDFIEIIKHHKEILQDAHTEINRVEAEENL